MEIIVHLTMDISTIERDTEAKFSHHQIGIVGLLQGLPSQVPAGVLGSSLVVGHGEHQVDLLVQTEEMHQSLLSCVWIIRHADHAITSGKQSFCF